MNSEKRSSRPLKFNFIRKKISLDQGNQPVLFKLRVKGIYLRELECGNFENRNVKFLRGKHTNYLNSFKIREGASINEHLIVKKAATLTSFTVNKNYALENIVQCIKKLSKKTEKVNIYSDQETFNYYDTKKLYRGLAGLTRLKALQMEIKPEEEIGSEEKEYRLINQYLPLLKYLTTSYICIPPSAVQKMMQENKVCPYITDTHLEPYDEEIESDEEEEEEEGSEHNSVEDENEENNGSDARETPNQSNQVSEIDNDEEDNEENSELQSEENMDEEEGEDDDKGNQIEEEVPAKKPELPCSFFRYQLFSNIRKLKLTFRRDYLQDSYVSESFKLLPKLEEFGLEINYLLNSEFFKLLYDDLLHLPLLTGLQLSIPFVREQESTSLIQFIQKQNQLIFLSLGIRLASKGKTEYEKHNQYIQDIGKCLENKSNLKYLSLKSDSWTIESLSQGLKKTTTLTQLQEFTVGGFDDNLTSKASANERIEGLCDFIKRHKHSLRNLEIYFQYVSDDEINNNIIKTLGELEELTKLTLMINTKNTVISYNYPYTDFFKDAYNVERKNDEDHLKFQQTFSFLSRTLSKLTNLSELIIELYPVYVRSLGVHLFGSYANSSIVFNSFPAMKHLKKLNLDLPYLAQAVEKNPTQLSLLLQLESIMSVTIIDSSDRRSAIKGLDKIKDQLIARQMMKTELMFYFIEETDEF